MDLIREAESELAHDYCDDRQHNPEWWRERRPMYVTLYRRVAQLDQQAEMRTFISVPPAWAAEQEQVEAEGQAEAQMQPHLRWSEMDWREHMTELLESSAWPPPVFTAALAQAENAVHSSLGNPGLYHLGQAKWRPRFAIGARVLAHMTVPGYSNEWWPGTVVWRLWEDVSSCEEGGEVTQKFQPYQVMLDGNGDISPRAVFAPADLDVCIKAGPAELSPNVQRAELAEQMNWLLLQAWWLQPGGYDECDIGGMLAIEMPPGEIGTGLVDAELEAGLMVHHRLNDELLAEHVVEQIEERLTALREAAERRAAGNGETADARPAASEENTQHATEDLTKPRTRLYDPRIPGAHVAEMMSEALGANRCVPVRDKTACAHCKQEVQPGGRLKTCERCRTVGYCGPDCQRQHWRVHKRTCTREEQRIDQVISGEAGQKPLDSCNRALVSAALDATSQHVAASRMLCIALTTGGLVEAISEEDLCSSLKLMFSVKLTPSDIEDVVSEDPATAAFYAERRDKATAKEAAMAASMQKVVRLCAGIHKSLMTILPGVKILRDRGANSPHPSNRHLVNHVHANIATSYKNVPPFLRLADECLAFHVNGSGVQVLGCPFTPEQLGRKVTVLKNLVYSAWLDYGRNFAGDDHSKQSDDEIVRVARAHAYVYSRRLLSQDGGPGMSVKEWMQQPGHWMDRDADSSSSEE